MKNAGIAVAISAGLALASHSNAALIEVVQDENTSDFTMQPNNDYGLLDGASGQICAGVTATSNDPIELTFEYLFKEAAYNNGFLVNGTEIFNTATASMGDTFTMTWYGGATLLDFQFRPNGLPNVTNGGNDSGAPANIFSLTDPATGDIILALDDSGFNNDDDYDDLVVRVSATAATQPPTAEVAEPATLALMGLGIVGLALTRVRRRT